VRWKALSSLELAQARRGLAIRVARGAIDHGSWFTLLLLCSIWNRETWERIRIGSVGKPRSSNSWGSGFKLSRGMCVGSFYFLRLSVLWTFLGLNVQIFSRISLIFLLTPCSDSSVKPFHAVQYFNRSGTETWGIISIGSVGRPYGYVSCGSGFKLARGIYGGSFVAYDWACSVRSFDRRLESTRWLLWGFSCWEWVVFEGVIVLWVGEVALYEGYGSNILQTARWIITLMVAWMILSLGDRNGSLGIGQQDEWEGEITAI